MNSKSTLSSWYKQILPLNAFSLGARVVFAFSLIADSLTISNRSNNSYRTNKDNNNNNNNSNNIIRVSPTRFWDSPSQTNLRSIVNIRDSWMKNETRLPELRSNLQIVVVWLSGEWALAVERLTWCPKWPKFEPRKAPRCFFSTDFVALELNSWCH